MRGLYAWAAVTDTVLAGLGRARARRTTKPVLMPALAADRTPTTWGPALGLAGSWAGDVALLRADDRSFLAGLSSFLTGHVAYAASFAARGGRPNIAHVLPVAAFTAVSAKNPSSGEETPR